MGNSLLDRNINDHIFKTISTRLMSIKYYGTSEKQHVLVRSMTWTSEFLNYWRDPQLMEQNSCIQLLFLLFNSTQTTLTSKSTQLVVPYENLTFFGPLVVPMIWKPYALLCGQFITFVGDYIPAYVVRQVAWCFMVVIISFEANPDRPNQQSWHRSHLIFSACKLHPEDS